MWLSCLIEKFQYLPYETTLYLFTLPLIVKMNLGRLFILNGGALLNGDSAWLDLQASLIHEGLFVY